MRDKVLQQYIDWLTQYVFVHLLGYGIRTWGRAVKLGASAMNQHDIILTRQTELLQKQQQEAAMFRLEITVHVIAYG